MYYTHSMNQDRVFNINIIYRVSSAYIILLMYEYVTQNKKQNNSHKIWTLRQQIDEHEDK